MNIVVVGFRSRSGGQEPVTEARFGRSEPSAAQTSIFHHNNGHFNRDSHFNHGNQFNYDRFDYNIYILFRLLFNYNLSSIASHGF
jgi:hypothetical protein